MSDIERYTQGRIGMRPSSDGEWVEYDVYAELQRQLSATRIQRDEALSDRAKLIERCADLSRQLDEKDARIRNWLNILSGGALGAGDEH